MSDKNQSETSVSTNSLTQHLNEAKRKVKPRWGNMHSIFQAGITYIKGRKLGLIRSLKTPWSTINRATVNGFEWGSMTVIGGRPGTGKTTLADQIIMSSYDSQPEHNHRTLQFQLEMPAKAQAVRILSAKAELTYNELCSAEKTLSDEDFQRCVKYAQDAVKHDIDVVDKTPTVEEFKSIVEDYMTTHATVGTEVKDKKTVPVIIHSNTIVSLDHSLLVRGKKGQKQQETLFELGEAITYLKRKYPIAFIILSQLNRNMDKPERHEDGKYSNYVMTSDIFGSDALLQHAETVIGLNLPAKQKIRFYGPERYIIENENILVMHIIKSRNGGLGLAFFNAQYNHMKAVEMAAPPPKQERISTKKN